MDSDKQTTASLHGSLPDGHRRRGRDPTGGEDRPADVADYQEGLAAVSNPTDKPTTDTHAGIYLASYIVGMALAVICFLLGVAEGAGTLVWIGDEGMSWEFVPDIGVTLALFVGGCISILWATTSFAKSIR